MKEKILEFLKENTEEFISGQKISEALGVSRAAIWKYIHILIEEGYEIESVSRNGYRLLRCPDIINFSDIKKELDTNRFGRLLHHFDTIDSTNNKAKTLARSGSLEGTIVISEEQTAGKGRLGRTWASPKSKGIWMSMILKPDIDPIFSSKITLIGAAAVHKALSDFNVETKIKWPNDIILNHKKICGILTEMSGELNQIHYIVMGIGINVNTEPSSFPDEIKAVATSLKAETGTFFNRSSLVAHILNHFERLYDSFVLQNNIEETIAVNRNHSYLIGKEVLLNKKGIEFSAKVLDMNSEGLLLIEYPNGNVEEVISGEISLHGLIGSK